MRTLKILATFEGPTSLLDALTKAGEDLSYNRAEGLAKVNRYQSMVIRAFVIEDDYALKNYGHNPVYVLRKTPVMSGFPSMLFFDRFDPFMGCLTDNLWAAVTLTETEVLIGDPCMTRKEAETYKGPVTK